MLLQVGDVGIFGRDLVGELAVGAVSQECGDGASFCIAERGLVRPGLRAGQSRSRDGISGAVHGISESRAQVGAGSHPDTVHPCDERAAGRPCLRSRAAFSVDGPRRGFGTRALPSSGDVGGSGCTAWCRGR